MGDLGQIGAITGQTLDQLGAQLHIPLDKLAQILGTDAGGLKTEFAKQESMASAALATAGNTEAMKELLADINATLQGKPLPFTTDQINAAQGGAQTSTGGKIGGPGGFKPPPSGVPQPVNDLYMQHPAGITNRPPAAVATAPVVSAIDRLNNRMDKQEHVFDEMLRELARLGSRVERSNLARV